MIKNSAIILCVLLISCKGNAQQKEVAIDAGNQTEKKYEISKTETEWKSSLTDIQFQILRKAGTERAFTSEFLENKKVGVYVCAGCNTEVFESAHKFDSGTGWPSFDREIKGNVAYDVDYKIGYKRTEEHCATCGGHLGHVFEDGPENTTGERHCINGAALKFIPKK